MTSRETLVLSGWQGGLNLAADPTLLEPTELLVADDMNLGPRGELRIREGAEIIDIVTDESSPTTLGISLDWIHALSIQDNADPTMLLAKREADSGDPDAPRLYWASAGGTLIPFTADGTIGTFGDLNEYMWFPQVAVLNNVAYVTAGGSTPKVYKVSGSATTAAVTAWDEVGVETDEFPCAGALLVAYERVFAANIQKSASVRTIDRLYFSEPLLPESWDATNYIDIAPDQGETITALRFTGDIILIFKETSIWALQGSDFEGLGLALYEVDGGIGCQAPGSIVSVGNALLFFDPAKGIYAYDGSGFINIGDKIYPVIRSHVEAEEVDTQKISAWYHDGTYNLYLRGEGAAEFGVYVYHLQSQSWTHHTWEPTSATSFVLNGRTFIYGVGDEPGLWNMYEGFVDPNGLPVEAQARTGWHSPGGAGLQHRIHGLETTVQAKGQNFTIAVIKDFESVPYAFEDYEVPESDTTMLTRTHNANGERFNVIQFVFDFWNTGAPWA